MNFDCLVIGSGIAGLSFALKVAESKKNVAIITKKRSVDSNTNYAQGGIACVMSKTDDFDLHVEDTLEAGDGLCDEQVVREIIADGPNQIQDLIDLGVEFTQLQDGTPSLGREGGHSRRRILHVKDLTGAAIEKALLHAVEQHENITTFEHYYAIDVFTRAKADSANKVSSLDENAVLGLYALDVRKNSVVAISAPVVMLATGGVGCVYQYTSNPDIATGDGIAIAHRAGVPIGNMEFIQFHPTTLYTSDDTSRFLISEAVRGEGAVLRNIKNESFMSKYHPKSDLAPRDVVARAIDQEMKISGSSHVWLDVTNHSGEELKERFPHIYNSCRERGIDISKEFIPVVPAAHYMCGGVETNLDGETSVNGLYVCGETACTGLHGANRLASNSLLEAVVMADRAANSVVSYLDKCQIDLKEIPPWVSGDAQDSDERVVLSHNLRELKQTMWDYVGIVRSTKRLERARTRIQNLRKEINDYYWDFMVTVPLLELRNLIQTADLIVDSALARKENKGLHYTLDCLESAAGDSQLPQS